MNIRKALITDLDQIRSLYYNTINTINTKDYDSRQIAAWSSGAENVEKWLIKISEQHFIVAEIENQIIGFSSLTTNGCLDFMFVHKDYQRHKVASRLLRAIEQIASNLCLTSIHADVSLTAKPFFLKMGFNVDKVYKKFVKDVEFVNTIMIRHLTV